MGRIILITGKGGVGKSSVAAAHAVKSAKEGKKTLLVSTDMAHNIADIFQKPVGGDITELADHLYGLELDPDRIMKEEFPDMNRSIAAMFKEAGFATQNAGEEMIFPGFDDLFCLLEIGKIHESQVYDRIIVDCAPTGETLSLLKLPELLAWYMEKFFPVGKAMVRILSPISRFRYHVELPSAEGMNDIEVMHRKLMQLQALLKDPEVSSVRLVCTPEKMVVEETKRNYMYMNLYGYEVDGLFINRVLVDDLHNPFFQHWREIQQKYIEELEAVFSQIPMKKIPWYPEEIRGKKALDLMEENMLTSGEDFFGIRVHREKEVYEEIDGRYCLMLPLPGANLQDLDINMYEMDLDISLDNFQRRIPLPNSLRGEDIAEVSLEQGILRIYFSGKGGDPSCEF